jgi:DNA-binding LacI/PurR family transcriptional regulator
LIGYDGIELSEIMELSTIKQPMRYMGELGAQKLIAQIEGPADGGSPPELIRLRPSLMMRRTISTPSPLMVEY